MLIKFSKHDIAKAIAGAAINKMIIIGDGAGPTREAFSHWDFEKRVQEAQIKNALGGMSNLYLEAALKHDCAGFRVLTHETFAFCEASKANILQETINCTGWESQTAENFYATAENFLMTTFQLLSKSKLSYRFVQFGPLGKFEAIDPKNGSYKLRYLDPAAKDYHRFLIGAKIKIAKL